MKRQNVTAPELVEIAKAQGITLSLKRARQLLRQRRHAAEPKPRSATGKGSMALFDEHCGYGWIVATPETQCARVLPRKK
ncbi:hypothetical protein J3169_004403 [Salmonella enterica]|nr:hypothetical protein [Salmonella enterica]